MCGELVTLARLTAHGASENVAALRQDLGECPRQFLVLHGAEVTDIG